MLAKMNVRIGEIIELLEGDIFLEPQWLPGDLGLVVHCTQHTRMYTLLLVNGDVVTMSLDLEGENVRNGVLFRSIKRINKTVPAR